MPANGVIRELFVALGVKADQTGMDAFEEGLDRIKGGMEALIELAAVAGAAVGAIGYGLVEIAGEVADKSKSIANTATALSMSTEEYQRLAYALEKYGAEATDLVDMLGQVAEYGLEAAAGNESYALMFQQLGLDAAEFVKLSPADQVMALADALAGIEDPTLRLSLASQLLGEDVAKKLLPVMVQGAEGFEKLGDEAERLGLVMSEQEIQLGRDYSQALVELDGRWTALKQTVGLAVIPVLIDLSERLMAWYDGNQALIEQRIEEYAEMLAQGADRLVVSMRELDTWVQKNYGSWEQFAQVLYGIAESAVLVYVAFQVAQIVIGFVQLFSILSGVWAVLSSAASGFMALASSLGVLVEVLMIAVEVGGPIFALGVGFDAAVAAMTPVGWVILGIVAALGALAAAALVLDDVWTMFQGGDSVIGRLLENFPLFQALILQGMLSWMAFMDLIGAGINLVQAWFAALNAVVSAAMQYFWPLVAVVGALAHLAFFPLAIALDMVIGLIYAVYNGLINFSAFVAPLTALIYGLAGAFMSVVNEINQFVTAYTAALNVIGAGGGLGAAIGAGMSSYNAGTMTSGSALYAPTSGGGTSGASIGGATVTINGIGLTQEQASALIDEAVKSSNANAQALLVGGAA